MAGDDPRTPIRQNIYLPDDPLSQALDRIQVLSDNDNDAMEDESDSGLDQLRSQHRSNQRRLAEAASAIARQALNLERQVTKLSDDDDDDDSGQEAENMDLDQDETEQPQDQDGEQDEEQDDEEQDDEYESEGEESNLPALNPQSSAADIRQWLDHASQLCTQENDLVSIYIISSAVFSYNTIQERIQETTLGSQDWSTFLSFVTQPIPTRKYCRIGFFSVWREDYEERRQAGSWAHAFAVMIISSERDNQKTLVIWDAEMPTRLWRFQRKPSNKRKPVRTTDVLLPRQRSIVGRVDNLTQVLVNSNEPRVLAHGACVHETVQFILAVARCQYGRCTVQNLLQAGFREIDYPSLY